MPIECPFHSQRDLLWLLDLEVKEALDSFQDHFSQSSWRCPIYDQTYFCIDRLLSHWNEVQRAHMDMVC